MNEYETIAADFQELVYKSEDEDNGVVLARIREFRQSTAPEFLFFVELLISIYRARRAIAFPVGTIFQGDITMDQSTHITARDIVASALGNNSSVTATSINAVQQHIRDSNLRDGAADVFNGVVEEVGNGDFEDVEKSELLRQVMAIHEELKQQQPRQGVLKMAWTAIKSIASALPSIATLGTWITTNFPDFATIFVT